MEASPTPGKAVPSAERLPGMMPAAGHLEHMPAHIMQRVGRYEDAAEANRKGVAADLAYFAATKPLDYYVMYTAHNYQFLAFSAAMEGRQAETMEAVRQSRALVPDEMLMMMPGTDWYTAELYAAMVRFGLWDEILAEPSPNPKLTGLTGAYLYAKAAALAAKGRVDEAKAELASLEKLTEDAAHDDSAGLNRLKDVLAVAVLAAKARIALAENKADAAISILREAVAREDKLAYSEPADWFFPNRHLLGSGCSNPAMRRRQKRSIATTSAAIRTMAGRCSASPGHWKRKAARRKRKPSAAIRPGLAVCRCETRGVRLLSLRVARSHFSGLTASGGSASPRRNIGAEISLMNSRRLPAAVSCGIGPRRKSR